MSILYALKEEVEANIATATSKFPIEDSFNNLKDDLDKFLRRGRWEGHGNKESNGKQKKEGSSNAGTNQWR